MEQIIEFLEHYFIHLLTATVFVLVVILILGKDRGKIIWYTIKHLIIGLVISAILYFLLHLSLKAVGSIGLIIFALTAIFGKLATK